MSAPRPLQDDDVIVELGDGNLYYFSPGEPPAPPPDAEEWTIPLVVEPRDVDE